MFFYVYVLFSQKDNRLYIGYTGNLDRRIEQHNSGKTDSLRHRRPLQLIYFEAFKTKQEALRREKFYKSGRGHEVLYKQLEITLNECCHGGPSESEGQMSVRL